MLSLVHPPTAFWIVATPIQSGVPSTQRNSLEAQRTSDLTTLCSFYEELWLIARPLAIDRQLLWMR